jgi:pimeloyl-ACP methyl ester carboxylesterase
MTTPLTTSSQHVRVAGLEAPANVQVAGDGPPLVFLHGPDGASWAPGLSALTERFTVYLPEHPGFGQTERPDWITSVRDLALYYLDLFEALDLERVNLVGHSLGGWIAAELASVCCHALRRLVLVDAAGLALRGEQRLDQFALSPAALIRSQFYEPALAERALAQEPTEDGVRAQVRNRAMTARLGWSPYLSDPSLQGRLHRVRVPTLVVWGAQDRLVPVTHAHAYAESIPQAREALIEACGHLPAVEQPAAFARLVGHFLAQGD